MKILGSRGRSKSQPLVSDYSNKHSIRGGAEGQVLLSPAPIGIGQGRCEQPCYRELRRILLLGNSVNRLPHR